MIKRLKILVRAIENIPDSASIVFLLPLLRDEIETLLSKIKHCTHINETGCYFDILEEIQGFVAGLIFKKEIQVSQDLWKFFRDFDRIDDQGERKYYFEEIKSGRYSLDAK